MNISRATSIQPRIRRPSSLKMSFEQYQHDLHYSFDLYLRFDRWPIVFVATSWKWCEMEAPNKTFALGGQRYIGSIEDRDADPIIKLAGNPVT